MLTSWMNEWLINVVHFVVQDYVTDAKLAVVGEVLGIVVYVVKDLLQQFAVLVLVAEGKFYHHWTCLYTIYNL